MSSYSINNFDFVLPEERIALRPSNNPKMLTHNDGIIDSFVANILDFTSDEVRIQ
jgi:S-adenosylmethionine:tRNA-ribosyltransferase-isomerase (queuine synthetase)